MNNDNRLTMRADVVKFHRGIKFITKSEPPNFRQGELEPLCITTQPFQEVQAVLCPHCYESTEVRFYRIIEKAPDLSHDSSRALQCKFRVRK